ncbi:MAG TPA: electron transport complex subunit RsxE [Sedimentisphaerales bacterium]|jgi:electron transport complex protein RnfE|nr:electron transport complex subunit RsxE [Sedimentisphaerales bacterium]HNU30061.1 electron transport complex subunit RsxE [Sedimentisphaerales bacterium]
MAATLERQNPYSEAVVTGLWREIPVFRMLLGTCPILAVTAAVKPALTMGLCVIFVLVCSNIMVSLMRKGLRPHVRILLFTLTIATFVTIADLFLRAYQPRMSEVLGPYVPLIIVNCVIIWRAEARASNSGVLLSIVDGLAMGLGFTIALCVLATIREILGTGKLFEIQILPTAFPAWAAMGMPVGAFLTFGFVLGFINYLKKKPA